MTPEVGRCYRRVWVGNPARRSPHRWVRKVDDGGPNPWDRRTVWTVLGPPGSDEWLSRTGARTAHGLDTFVERYRPCPDHAQVGAVDDDHS